MEDTLQFKGINYISSKRAAELVGYTKDYVGQLCRAGKLEARLVGRSWYVSEPSILQHKLSVHYTLHQPINERGQASERHAQKDVTQVDAESEEIPLHILESREKEVHDTRTPTHSTIPVRVYTTAKVRRQKVMLANTDVRYEDSDPLFYEDDRPVNPEPVRMTRFQDVPIVSPVQTRSSVVKYANPATPTMNRPVARGAQAPVDGVVAGRERALPQKRRTEERQQYAALAKRQTPQRRASPGKAHTGSKAVPVLGGILALLILALVYYVRELGLLSF